MNPPLFLSLAEALDLHRDLIRRYGGTFELRDAALLESALAMPASSFGGEYLHPDLAAMGAFRITPSSTATSASAPPARGCSC